MLLALTNARVNFRNEQAPKSFEEMREQMHRQPQHDSESADEPPLPREWLTIERLYQMRKMAFLTGKVFWDLELHQPTPDLDAFETLLGERYGYYTDDAQSLGESDREERALPVGL